MTRGVPDFDAGEIVLIPHAPFSDQLATKARPSLIVSSKNFNSTHADVVCIAISSRMREHDPYTVEVYPSSDGFLTTGLKCASSLKCGAIFAYSTWHIRRRLGRLPAPVLEQVRGVLSAMLGLPST